MAETTRPIGLPVSLGPLAKYRQILLSAAVLAALLILASVWPKPAVAELISAGDSAWNKSDLTLAHANYYQASLYEPENAGLHLKLSRVYEEAKDYIRATEEAVQAQTLLPELNLGEEIKRLAFLRDEPKMLREELAKTAVILIAYPGFRDAWYKAAYLHYRLKEDDLAREAIRKTLELDPNFSPARELLERLE